MFQTSRVVLLAALALATPPVLAAPQDAKEQNAEPATSPKESSRKETSQTERPDAESKAQREGPQRSTKKTQDELEAEFKKTLTGATMTGRWRTVKDGKLSEEREEKYSVTSATKAGQNLWIILARVQYGEKDVTLPVPVTVLWAGDTPIISVTDAGLPGLGTYTARVMIYRDLYSGTWFGPNVAGFLSGTIERTPKEKDSSPVTPAPSEGDTKPGDQDTTKASKAAGKN